MAKYPFICAGMAYVCDLPELCIAVTKAGGIGSLSGSFLTPETLRKRIDTVKAATPEPFHVNLLANFLQPAHIDVCIETQVPIVSFHWGLPANDMIARLKSAGTKIWVQVGSVDAARKAEAAGADAIVAQGEEAGGHNYAGPPLSDLLPAVIQAVNLPVFAAGGIADGASATAALSMGASAVWVGTRMVATLEANAHPVYKQAIVDARGEDTILSSVYGPELPSFNPMRLIRNSVIEAWNTRIDELEADRAHFTRIGQTPFRGRMRDVKPFDAIIIVPETTGSFDQMPMLAGKSAEWIHSISPAADVVHDIMSEARKRIPELSSASMGL